MSSSPESASYKLAIVVSRYNDSITEKLLEGARLTASKSGFKGDEVEIAWVPGAWELPLLVQDFAVRPDVVGVVALGCVIKGDTTHDQHINRAVSTALMEIGLRHSKPIGFGLLTCNTLDQAIHRAGGNVGNKGQEAAEAVIEMIRLRSFRQDSVTGTR